MHILKIELNVVPLCLDLAELHERVAYGCVAMGVILHGVADYIGHLVEVAVVDGLHGMQYSPLHGL